MEKLTELEKLQIAKVNFNVSQSLVVVRFNRPLRISY